MRENTCLRNRVWVGASLAALCSCALPAGAQAAPLPDGWIVPTEGQLAGPDRTLRREDPHRYLEVEADFDGDGDVDVARLLVDASGREYALFISAPANGGFAHRRVATGPAAEIDRVGITDVAPGRYATACGKGLGADRCATAQVSLTHTGVSLFTFEAGAEYVFWDGSGFETAAVAD